MNLNNKHAPDAATAAAFATSWNNLPAGSVYSRSQVEDWFTPLNKLSFHNKKILELGCGSASLLTHVLDFEPEYAVGVDLGSSVEAALRNMKATGKQNWNIVQQDLCTYNSEGFDIVYSIGVIHHLQNPLAGFLAVVRNTKLGGHFHCWVYGYEGNGIIRMFVDPLRKICSKLPWWFTKYVIATPLSTLYFIYAKIVATLPPALIKFFPLGQYSCWIAKREFTFFRHVVFDQLVTPQTVYIKYETIKQWLIEHPEVDFQSTYIIQRNGNSWKFGGVRTQQPEN